MNYYQKKKVKKQQNNIFRSRHIEKDEEYAKAELNRQKEVKDYYRKKKKLEDQSSIKKMSIEINKKIFEDNFQFLELENNKITYYKNIEKQKLQKMMKNSWILVNYYLSNDIAVFIFNRLKYNYLSNYELESKEVHLFENIKENIFIIDEEEKTRIEIEQKKQGLEELKKKIKELQKQVDSLER